MSLSSPLCGAKQEAAPARKVKRIERLLALDLRCHARIDLCFDAPVVVITGPNGAGKTALLEAMTLFSPGRSLRGAPLESMIREGATSMTVHLGVQSEDSAHGLGVYADREILPVRRKGRIDAAQVATVGHFTRYVHFSWLEATQEEIMGEGSSARRRFFDRMAAAHDPSLPRCANAYERAMRQRMRLLEHGSKEGALLDVYEETMACKGVAIAAARLETRRRIMQAQGLPFALPDVTFDGFFENGLERGEVAASLEDAFAQSLCGSRPMDALQKKTAHGPHRTRITFCEKNSRRRASLCSAGEQKAMLLDLLLANAHSVSGCSGAPAMVLLLDEAALHMDAHRIARLRAAVDAIGLQTFVTDTSMDAYKGWKSAAFVSLHK